MRPADNPDRVIFASPHGSTPDAALPNRSGVFLGSGGYKHNI
jgi:hypothetical protein